MRASEKKIEQLRDHYFQQISGQTEIRNDAAKVEKELEHIIHQGERLKKEHLAQQAALHEKEKACSQREETIHKTQAGIDQKDRIIHNHTKELESLGPEINELEKRLAGLKDERDKSLHHLHALEKLREQEGRSRETTELPESFGLLADLVEGQAQNGFLIDIFYKEEAKATLIDASSFLKSMANTKLQGQFLLLPPNESKPKASPIYQDPRVLGLLKSQMRADNKIKHKLSTLPEAAIVNDLKTAVELWLEFPVLNYVTVEGDLLLSSGLVKAGKKQEGLIALTQQIKSLQEKTKALQTDISPLESHLQTRTADMEKLQSLIHEERNNQARLKLELESIVKGLEFDRSELQKAATTLSLLEKEQNNLSHEKKEITQRFTSLQKAIAGLSDQESQLKQNLQEEEGRIETLRGETEYIHTQYFEFKTEIDVIQEKMNGAEQLQRRLIERRQNLSTRLESLGEDMDSDEGTKQTLKSRIQELAAGIAQLEKRTKESASSLTEDESNLSQLQQEQQELEDKLLEQREEYESAKETRVKWEVSKAERERDLVNLEESCWQELKKTLKEVKAEVEPEEIDLASVETSLEDAKEKLQRFKAVNLMAEEEYLTQKKRYDFLTKEQEDLVESIASTREAIKKIDQESKNQFLKALIEVNKNFQDVFSLLFKGGPLNSSCRMRMILWKAGSRS